jgi:hypothetical protein
MSLECEELCPCCGKLIGVRQIYQHVARTRQALELELAHENLDPDMELDLDIHVGTGGDSGIDGVKDERTYYSISNWLIRWYFVHFSALAPAQPIVDMSLDNAGADIPFGK